MARRRKWTIAKRRRARRKAEAALKERRRVITETRERSDTGYAGMLPVVEYAGKELKIRKRLEERLKMIKGRTATFSPLDEAMAYLGCQIAGIVRLNHIDRLLPEGALAELLELPRWPSENTEQRFLRRASPETLVGVDRILQRLVEDEELPGGAGLIEVDGDLTGIPQRGRKREGVEIAWCSGRTRPCYQQPRVTVNGLPWWTDLRRGKDMCSDLPERTLETGVKLAREWPKREIFCRMDGYYVSKEYLRSAEEAGKRYSNLKFLQVVHPKKLKEGGWEQLVKDTPGPWTWVNSTTRIKELGSVRVWDDVEPMRAIAVRRKEGRTPAKAGPTRGRKPREELHYLIVTNVSRKRLGTRKVFKRYHQRQREEFSFKDGKQSLSTAKMPTSKLEANRMHVKIVALAQLMLQMFARRFLPHPGRYGPTCKTIREKVVAVGGKNNGRESDRAGANLLRLPLDQVFAGACVG
jgi:hypothetical protein